MFNSNFVLSIITYIGFDVICTYLTLSYNKSAYCIKTYTCKTLANRTKQRSLINGI